MFFQHRRGHAALVAFVWLTTTSNKSILPVAAEGTTVDVLPVGIRKSTAESATTMLSTAVEESRRLRGMSHEQSGAGAIVDPLTGIVHSAHQDTRDSKTNTSPKRPRPPASAHADSQDETPVDDADNTPPHCGCWDCTDDIWNLPVTDASGTYTCGDRIAWVMSTTATDPNMMESDACLRVAATEAATAAVCGPACNPTACDGRQQQSVYCFPPNDQNQIYENVWGKYRVQVKESSGSDGLCGPGNNRFVRDTVQLARNSNEDGGRDDFLLLNFQKVNGIWSGAEVRIVPPEEEGATFSYGTYTFSVRSVAMLEANGESVVVSSNELPPSLVLGMFTWDNADSFELHENYNHEVDIEISQWGDPRNANAQFLVQPPGEPQHFRFDTGATASGGPSNLNGHSWSFTWLPGQVDWYTTAAGGVSHSYSVSDALQAGTPDYVQCLPGRDMDVRINLWNVLDTNTPMNMQENQSVKVIVDRFEYIPSDLKYVDNGGACTKDCQCSPDSVCLDNVCTERR